MRIEKLKKFISIILLFFILANCGTFSEAGKILRNEKIKTTDEFLVEKKEPLTTPPEIFELPKPEELKKENTAQSKIQGMLNSKGNTAQDNDKSSAEERILKKIKK